MSTSIDPTLNDDNDDVTDVDDDAATETDWTPPTKEEFEDLLAKHKRANGEAATRKRWLRDLGYDPKTGKKVGADSNETDTDDVDTARDRERQLAKIEQYAQDKADAITDALDEAGVSPKNRARVRKLLDKSAITFDEDGLDGLVDQLDELKADIPNLFKRVRALPADGSAIGTGQKAKPDATESKTWQDDVRERFNKGLI